MKHQLEHDQLAHSVWHILTHAHMHAMTKQTHIIDFLQAISKWWLKYFARYPLANSRTEWQTFPNNSLRTLGRVDVIGRHKDTVKVLWVIGLLWYCFCLWLRSTNQLSLDHTPSPRSFYTVTSVCLCLCLCVFLSFLPSIYQSLFLTLTLILILAASLSILSLG